MSLTNKQCIPCEGGVSPLTSDQAEALLVSETPAWAIVEESWQENNQPPKEIRKLRRIFEFNNFVSAMDFANQVGALAEDEGHHPDITIGWGYCQVVFYTHTIEGLHENDFIMAAKVDQLAAV